MLYDLKLEIGSEYDHPVATGRHVLRAEPLSIDGRQTVHGTSISLEPEPESRRDFTGYFGARETGFAIRHPHTALRVKLEAQVEVTSPDWAEAHSIPCEDLQLALATFRSVAPSSPHHFTGPSPRLPLGDAAIAAYARESLSGHDTIAAVSTDLMKRINADFKYDAKATSVDTTPAEAFGLKRGVCQDFTHVMITGLRSLGIPAAYVSGYLRTLPPAGKPRLIGADAMHAWVRVWCGPGAGWIEYDPTNRMLASSDHIVAGFGRDYSDIAPLAGTVKGHGGQDGFQRVDIAVRNA